MTSGHTKTGYVRAGQMSDVLALAGRLRAMGDRELADAARAREISAAGIKDFFDLAEAFLAENSVQQMLTRLERQTLAVLAAAGEPQGDGTAPSITDVVGRLHELGATTADARLVAQRAAEA